MTKTDDKKERLDADRELVRLLTDGDDDAWAKFVELFTDWVLYKSREWCVGHCPHNAGSYRCGLVSLRIQREGGTMSGDQPECDDGLDTYVWVFEQLRRRVKKYAGKNGCLLSTYVWTILNSRELYIDWSRNRYGRAF